jgi:hypothetical protein
VAEGVGRGGASKKCWSVIQEQVAGIRDQFDALNKATGNCSCPVKHDSLKTERYKAKLNAHSQEQDRQLLREQLRSSHDNDELSHRRSQESKETDIRLHEADVKAAIAEAEALRLRIEYHKLCNSG